MIDLVRRTDRGAGAAPGVALSRDAGAERLIAAGRVVLVAVTLTAAWFDSGVRPAADFPTLLVGVGLLYAVAVAALTWRPDATAPGVPLAVHLVDLVLFSALVAVHGSTSPFYLYYLFLILAGALRWQAKGVVATGVATALAFIALALYDAAFGRLADFDLVRFAMRLGYFAVATLLLAYLVRHQHDVHADLARLASPWPGVSANDRRGFLAATLEHVARLSGAARVVLACEEHDEPAVEIVEWAGGRVEIDRIRSSPAASLLDPALAHASFHCHHAAASPNVVLVRGAAGMVRWTGEAFDPALRARLRARRVLSCPLALEPPGRVFLLDGPFDSADDLLFAEALARLLAARLDRQRLAQQLHDAAVREARARYSRELHDGVLQSLTGWRLAIEDVGRRIHSTDPAAAGRLDDLRRQMSADQRELRQLVGRDANRHEVEPADFNLTARLHAIADRFAKDWGLSVELDLSRLHARVPPAMAHDICRLAHEGLSNAARHARTSLVRLALAASGSGVSLSIQDRGRGFPFRGRYDLDTLRRQQLGPSTLLDRVSALGGSLVLESTDSGSRLDIVLPDAGERRRDEYAS